MGKKILAYIDHHQGNLQRSSLEAVGVAARMASDLDGEAAALILGSELGELPEQAVHHGADQVLIVEHDALEDFIPEILADALKTAAESYQPDVIIFPTTTRGKTLAGMAAVDLDSGVMGDVIDLDWSGDQLTATRPIYAGKLLSTLTCAAKPQIVTLQARAYPRPEPDPERSGEITAVEVDLDEKRYPSRLSTMEEKEQNLSLTDASVIVSGGRGTSNNKFHPPPAELDDDASEIWKAQQGFELIKQLAEVLGAAVGASRAAVDGGYIEYDHQIGQTGKVVTPDLYIACGISGAVQHLAGMVSSKTIVAINKDPDAPIFHYAHFGVVADLYEILPPLTERLRSYLEG